MMNQSLLDRLKPACARILRAKDRTPYGTGYLVPGGFVATCHHVVSEVAGEELICRFGDVEVVERVAHLLRWDEARDTALLALDGNSKATSTSLPESVVVEPVAPSTREWYGYGFPQFAELLGIPLVGQILDANTVDKEGRPAICVSVDQFAGELPPSVGGLSGTPILAGRRLIGQLFRVLGAEDGWQRPRLSLCYATPAWAIAGLVTATGSGNVSGQTPPPTGATSAARPTSPELAEHMRRYGSGAEALASLRAAGNPKEVLETVDSWDSTGLPREQGALLAAETLLGMAATDEALRVLEPVAETDRGRQLCALALSIKGEHHRARALLQALPVTEETAGITGGILKRRWLDEGRHSWLVASHDAYRSQNDVQPSAYLAVNVAALGLQLGDREESQREAKRTRELVLATSEKDRDFWAWASLAEAELLLGDLASARLFYQHAVAGTAGNARNIAVMRRQARLDLEKLGMPRGALDGVLRVGSVACFLSALLDDGAWTPKRLAVLRERFGALVKEERAVVFGYGSAARGADLLFVEALAKVGATAGLVIPMPPREFEAAFVGPAWADRFRRISPEHLQVVRPTSPERPFSGCEAEAERAAVEMGRCLDERPLLIAVPPPAGAPDPRGVRQAMERWAAGALGEVVEVPLG